MDLWFVQAGYRDSALSEIKWVTVGTDNREARGPEGAWRFESLAEAEAWQKSSAAKSWMPCEFRVRLFGSVD